MNHPLSLCQRNRFTPHLERCSSGGRSKAPADMTNDLFALVLGLQMDPDADKATAFAIEVAYTLGGAT